jgi:tyrosine-protein kinase Etk/Wzc
MAEIGETELDLRALSSALWRRAWLLFGLAIVAAIVTYIGLSFVSPLYTADTSILIEDRESPLTRPRDQPVDTTTAAPDESAIQSQVQVLKSREVANAVIDDLKLTSQPEFDPARKPSMIGSLLVALGLSSNPTDSTIRQRVMDSYFARLSVFPVQQSRVIGVQFSASQPKLAADVANAVADSFVKLQQDAKRQSALEATEWLQQQIEQLRGRVADAEQAVANYRTSHGLYDLDNSTTGNTDTGSTGGGSSNLSTQQLGDMNAELARARAARAEAEARANAVQQLLDQGASLDSSGDVLNSPLIQRLRERQVALQAQIADLSTTLLPTHPRMRALEEQVANLDTQIRAEAEKVLASLNTAARIAAAREQSLVKSLNDAKADVSRSNDQGIELRALEREATAQRDLLESFLSRYREAAARTDANYLPADARIISHAVEPLTPSFPKKTMMSIAAALAVLLIAAAIVLLREFMSGRAFRLIGYSAGGESAPSLKPAAAHAERKALPEPEASAPPPSPPSDDVEVVPVGTVDEAESEDQSEEKPAEESEETIPEEEAVDEPQAEATGEPEAEATDEAADGKKSEATELAKIIGGADVKIALFVGAEGGEGTGAIAFSAAREAADDKLRSIVIDLGREPSEALGQERPGLCDLLAGGAAFGEVIQRDEDAGVHVVPFGPTGEDPAFERLQLVIGALAHSYDKVMFVADKLDDWPDAYLQPDVAAVVCAPEMTENRRSEVYDAALARGAKSAVIVRFASETDAGGEEESAAA